MTFRLVLPAWNAPDVSLFKTGPNIFYARRWEGGVWGNYPPNSALEYYGIYGREVLLPQCFDLLATAAMLLTDHPYVRGGCAWWIDTSPLGGDYVDLYPQQTRAYNEEFLRSCGDPDVSWR